MHRVLDAPFLELLWDFPPDQGSNLLPSFTVRYYRGLTGDRPAWILPYLCEQGQFGMQAPMGGDEQLLQLAGPYAQQVPMIIEAGAAAMIAVTAHSPFGETERATGRWLPYLRLLAAIG